MRPEHENPPEIYYNETEARKYTKNSRIQEIQAEMTERAIELLQFPEDKCGFILDIGCGSGLSGEVLEENGHIWVGLDISESMLNVARDEREVDGDLLLHDAGSGVGFRPGTFDGVISISCIQWLCNSDYKSHNPRRRLCTFFSTLYGSMRQGARAVFQFYPENPSQIEMITSSAMQAGFGGGLIIDYPNSTKRKKYFLCLFAGVASNEIEMPRALDESMDYEYSNDLMNGSNDNSRSAKVKSEARAREMRLASKRMKKRGAKVKDIDWIMKKKETRRKRGQHVANDSKYTGRKRKVRF